MYLQTVSVWEYGVEQTLWQPSQNPSSCCQLWWCLWRSTCHAHTLCHNSTLWLYQASLTTHPSMPGACNSSSKIISSSLSEVYNISCTGLLSCDKRIICYEYILCFVALKSLGMIVAGFYCVIYKCSNKYLIRSGG